MSEHDRAAPASSTFVLGLGNVLMGDDGFGPAVVRAFDTQFRVDDPHVTIADLGTPGFDLLPWLADAGHVVIVDTIAGDLPPGTLRMFSKRDLLRHAPGPRVSPHDGGLKQAVLMLEFAGRAPAEITIIGVSPGRIGLDLELTAPVRDAVPQAVDAIASVLQQDGIAVTRAVPRTSR